MFPFVLIVYHPSGFYGGPVDYQQYGNATQIFSHGLVCAEMEAGNMATNIKVKSVAFDTMTGNF